MTRHAVQPVYAPATLTPKDVLYARAAADPYGLSVADLKRVVLCVTGVTVEEIAGRGNVKYVANARVLSFWLVRRFNKLGIASLHHIARHAGRDHTTVLYGVRRVDDIVRILGVKPLHDNPVSWCKAIWRTGVPYPAQLRAIEEKRNA